MDSRLHGVSLSAAKVAPMAAPSYNTATGIRAPLTIDESDFEYSVSSVSHMNSPASSYYSVTEVESDGFVSDGDESETDSERPYVTHHDDGILEETHFVKKFAFSKPSMVNPNGEYSFRESSNSTEHEFPRPSVKSPDEAVAKESEIFHGNSFFRPSVRSPDEISYKGIGNINNDSDEPVEDEDYVLRNHVSRPLVGVMDEDVSENERTPVLDIEIPVAQKVHIPIARISRDSDDDSHVSEVSDHEGFSCVARVPSIEVLHRINSAPRVSMSDADEWDDDDSQSENTVEMEFLEDLGISNGVLSPKDEKECIGVDDTVHWVVSADMIQDKGPDANKEARANSLVVNEENISETEKNGNLMHLDEEIQEKIAVIYDRRMCVDLVDQREPADLAEAVPVDDGGTKSSNTASEINLAFNQGIGSEKLESKSGKEIESEVENSAFHTEAMVAEMEREQDFTSLSGGEFLLDHSQEIDGQIVTDSDEGVGADGAISDHGQRVDSAAFFKAARGAVSDDGAVKLTTTDGIENLSLESNLPDLGSMFHSRRPILEARNPNIFMPPSTNGDKKAVMELDAPAKGGLDFSMCIMVIGKTGVGKSATINSIFGEKRTEIDAFEPSTNHVKEIIGHLDGIKVKIFDTPGLRTSLIDLSMNRKILSSIKKVMQKSPPDVILYVDRLDTQINNLNDLPLLKSITACLGSSIWRKSLVVLTHATSVPPDGPDGYPLSYEVFVAQRSRFVQQLISRSSGELLMTNPSSLILVENHPFAQKNEYQEALVHNGESWRSQLLFLCCSMMTLSDSSSVVKVQNPLNHRKLFGLQVPLSYFLSSLLQSNDHPKLSNDQSGEIVDSDVELDYSSDADQEEDIEHDNLPPFKPLTKSQVANLSRDQKKAYFEEYDYRVKLLQKKQLREEMKRLRDTRKVKNGAGGDNYIEGVVDQETGIPRTIAVPSPDKELPPSFDGENPSFRYCFPETSSQLLTRPLFYANAWDHDCGYDGVLIEDKTDLASHFPSLITVQLTKDKKELDIWLLSSVAVKHGYNKGLSSMAALDIQTLGKKLAYILKGETKMKNFRKHKTAAGVSITFLEQNVLCGLKIEDRMAVGKQLTFVGNAGVVHCLGDAAYGVNLDLCRRDDDYPNGQDPISVGLSVMRCRGDFLCGCNVQSQFSVGRNSKVNVVAGLNSKLSGQVCIKTTCSDQLQIAALALIPIAKAIFKQVFQKSN